MHELRLDRLDAENASNSENVFAANGFELLISNSVVDTSVYQTSFDVTENHRITGAVERREESFVQRGPVSFGNPNRDEEMDTRSFVFEYDVRPTDNLSLLFSWRSDDNSHFGDTSTKRISGAWRLGQSGTRLRAAYGEGIKNPTFTERFGFFTDFIGNPALTPERAESWELGIDHSIVDINLNVSATVFDEKLENEINGFVFDVTAGGFTSANQPGESRRQGIELAGAWRPSDRFAMQFSWTTLDAEELDSTGTASREIRRPEQSANLGMQLSAIEDRLNVGLNVAWNSQQDDFFFPPVPPFQERVSLDSFGLVALSVAYDLSSALSIYGRIENALDDEYEEVFGFRANDRQFFIGLRYRL
jgi:vitamin B12 transporter